MPAALYPILIFGTPLAAMIVMMIMGCVESIKSHKLRKYGKKVEGYIEDVDLKAEYHPVGVYGKVYFTYRVNDKTYMKRQTVAKHLALQFLTARSARPFFAERQKVNILFLPRRPRVARLATAPSDYARISHALLSLLVLLFLVLLFLILIFANIHNQPGYGW